MHAAHRNPSVPAHYTSDMIDQRHHRARHRRRPLDVRRGDRRGHGAQAAGSQQGRRRLQDPLLVLLEMGSGVLVDVEASVNAGSATTSGARSSARTAPWSSRRARARSSSGPGGYSGRVPADWRERFVLAYDIEFQEWVDAVHGGRDHRAERVGRLRGHRRVRHGPRRPALRAARTRRPAGASPTSTSPISPGRPERMKIAARPLHAAHDPAARAARPSSPTWATSTSSSRRATDFLPFFLHPRAGRRRRSRRCGARSTAAGVEIASVPAAVQVVRTRRGRAAGRRPVLARAIQVTVDLGCDVMNSEFNGRPESAAASEAQFWRSMEELLPGLRAGGRAAGAGAAPGRLHGGRARRGRPDPRHRQRPR